MWGRERGREALCRRGEGVKKNGRGIGYLYPSGHENVRISARSSAFVTGLLASFFFFVALLFHCVGRAVVEWSWLVEYEFLL